MPCHISRNLEILGLAPRRLEGVYWSHPSLTHDPLHQFKMFSPALSFFFPFFPTILYRKDINHQHPTFIPLDIVRVIVRRLSQ
jgi:hypothetical protein